MFASCWFILHTIKLKYCRVYGDYMRPVLDWQLDLLDTVTDTLNYSVHTSRFTTVDLNTRLATAPQPVFHCTVFSWPSLFTGSSLKTAYWNCSSSELTVAAPSWLITHWHCQPSTNSYGIPCHHSLFSLRHCWVASHYLVTPSSSVTCLAVTE
jgi:hypothetical protein